MRIGFTVVSPERENEFQWRWQSKISACALPVKDGTPPDRQPTTGQQDR